MGKHIVIVALWGYAAWYLGAMIAVQFGLPAPIGPLLGVAGAAFIARNYTWSAAGRVRTAVASSETATARTAPHTTSAP